MHVGADCSANGGGTASEAGGKVVRDNASVNDVLLGRPRPSQHTGEVVDALFRHLTCSIGVQSLRSTADSDSLTEDLTCKIYSGRNSALTSRIAPVE